MGSLGGATINLILSFVLSGVSQVESVIPANLIARSLPTLGYTPQIGNVSGLALANSLGVAFEVLLLLVILRRRWNGIHENVLAQTTLKALIASLIMALVVIGIDTLWRAIGLSNRGLVFTILQISVEALAGLATFVIVAATLKMSEINELKNIILRRTPTEATESVSA